MACLVPGVRPWIRPRPVALVGIAAGSGCRHRGRRRDQGVLAFVGTALAAGKRYKLTGFPRRSHLRVLGGPSVGVVVGPRRGRDAHDERETFRPHLPGGRRHRLQPRHQPLRRRRARLGAALTFIDDLVDTLLAVYALVVFSPILLLISLYLSEMHPALACLALAGVIALGATQRPLWMAILLPFGATALNLALLLSRWISAAFWTRGCPWPVFCSPSSASSVEEDGSWGGASLGLSAAEYPLNHSDFPGPCLSHRRPCATVGQVLMIHAR